MQIISLVNKATNEIRESYGLENFDIPPENIHIVFEKAWLRLEKDNESVALYSPMMQGILMREQPAKIVFAEKLFHEMLHFKSYNALQVTNSENPELDGYRIGLIVYTRDGKKTYFRNLNEAVDVEMVKRFIVKLSNNPLFTKELEQTK